MEETITYKELVAIVTVCYKLADIDELSQEEMAIIGKVMNHYMQSEEQFDALARDAATMDTKDAVVLLNGLSPENKQFVADLLLSIVAADGELTPKEKEAFFLLKDACGLPLPKAVAEKMQEEEVEEEEEEDNGYENVDPVFPVIRYTSYSRNTLDGELVLLPEGEDPEDTVFGYFDNPKNLQFWRTSRTLDLMNAKLELPEDTQIIMIFFKPGLFGAKGEPNKCGTLVAEKKVTGPVLFALEDSEEQLYGFPDKELLRELMDWLDALANHQLLADGDSAEAVSAKNMELALEAIDALK